MKKLLKLFMSFVMIFSLIACSSNGGKDQYFSDWKFIRLDFSDASDVVVIQYTLSNTTDENWKDSFASMSGRSHKLKIGKNEYEWFTPRNSNSAKKEFMGLDPSSGEPHSISYGEDNTVMVCFRVNPNDFNDNSKDITLLIDYAFMKYKKKISADDFETIDVGSTNGMHFLASMDY